MTITLLATNRKALYSFAVEDTFEAGVILEGWEVKAIRKGKMNISGAFVENMGGEIYLINSSITPCAEAASHVDYPERRHRKLLLHKKEVNKIAGHVKNQGATAVVLKVYANARGKIKLEIATVLGKTKIDKRETIKNREWQRDKAKIMKMRGGKH
jgi:SsrA-binding protein